MPNPTRRDELHRAILHTLRAERIRKELSGNVLAERAGLNQSAISLLDHGRRSPSLETLLRIAEALEVDLWTLIKTATEKIRA